MKNRLTKYNRKRTLLGPNLVNATEAISITVRRHTYRSASDEQSANTPGVIDVIALE